MSIGAVLLAIEILLFWYWDFAQASVIENDPQGFQGIRWGTDLNTLPNLVLVDQSDHIQTYVFVEQPPRFGEVSVESIKLLAIDQQLARVLIRYHGEQTHSRIVKFLESAFGKIDLAFLLLVVERIQPDMIVAMAAYIHAVSLHAAHLVEGHVELLGERGLVRADKLREQGVQDAAT